MNKCKKCKKPISRNEVWEKHVGYFHQSCWYDWKKKKLKREVDKDWQLKGMEEWGKMCFCGNPAAYCHHFFYKSSYPALRYERLNAIPICPRCHTLIHARDPKELNDKIISHRGKEWYDHLKHEAQTRPLPQRNLAYYEKIKQELQG